MVATTSIITTVYNQERYLGAAIESVLAQTLGDFELLVWDDGSTDSSVNIARHYEKHDRRVRLVAREHQGRAHSLKAAHAQAAGSYVGWLDSDDIIAPTALEETVTVLDAHPEVGLVYTDYLVIDELDKVKGYGQRCRIPYSKDRLLVDFMTFHFRLLRRSSFDAAGGIDLSFQVAVDYDLCLRLSEVTQVQHVQKPLYYYRYHRSSMSNQQRLEQILASLDAIARALKRRGLSDRYEINMQIVGQYFLRRKGG
jgi:glycosyltransferase involved in cell wall biosynthesis